MAVLQFALLGSGVGALYSIIALGVILIYRSSGVVNLAQGGIGMAAAYIFWSLHYNSHRPFALSFVVAVGGSILFGAAVQWLIMRPLRTQSVLTRTLATLGILVSLTAAFSLKWPGAQQFVPSSLPTRRIEIAGLFVGEDRLIILAIVLVISIALSIVYRYTRFGLSTTAITENPLAAATLGFSQDAIAGINWAIGAGLAGVAGILLVPISGLSVPGMTTFMIAAYAAVVMGNFTSFPVTLGAGLLLGILQAEVIRYLPNANGLADALPFIVVLIVLAVRGRTLPGKGDKTARLPRVGSGRVRPWALGLFVGGCLIVVFTTGYKWVSSITVSLTAGLVLLSIVVVTGYAGQLSLAQYSLAGLGGWIAARFAALYGFPFWLALIAGVVVALPVGVIVGLASLRTRGVNLAIATLGLAVAVYYLIFNNPSLAGSLGGFPVGNPSIFGIDLSPVINPRPYAIFTIVLFTLAALVTANLRRSRTGRRLLAVRTDERAAASLGIPVVLSKLYAFALGSAIAALGGVLIAFANPFVTFTEYDPLSSITYTSYGVVGGVGQIGGSVAGAQLVPGAVGTQMVDLLSMTVQNYFGLASGIIMIVILIVNADGMAYVEAQRWRRILARGRSRAPDAIRRWLTQLDRLSIDASRAALAKRQAKRPRSELSIDRRGCRQAVCAEGVSVSFGGVKALVDVNLDIRPGEVVGLIGPNGAGKSTFIDVISGFTRATSGTVRVGEETVTAYSARKLAGLGIARSFQDLCLFDDLTVYENLLVASEPYSWTRFGKDLIRPGRPVIDEEVSAAIEQFRLEEDLDRLPTQLPHGRRHLVAIARALATNPGILLLDEPAAGLSDTERQELLRHLRMMVEVRGVGVLLVEHDVDFVMGVCDRIVALDFGHVIAQGSPAEVRSSPSVIGAYLGEQVSEDVAGVKLDAAR